MYTKGNDGSRSFLATAATMLAVLCLGTAPLLAGDVTVSGPFAGEITGGDWRGTYGECFYLIPQPDRILIEEPVGPDFFSLNHRQYAENNCYGGSLFSNFANESKVDWRIFKNDADPTAFAYTTDDPRPGSAQYNPCLDDFLHATWDNDRSQFDPLTVEVVVEVTGSIEVAYYFTNANTACRELDYDLLVDGMLMAEGTIGDFAEGKYVVFDIGGLDETMPTTITFTAEDAPGDPTCAPPADGGLGANFNTHISAVLIGGPDCLPKDCTICGDGILDPGEQCDDGNNIDGDGCSADCKLEQTGGEGCTPGYWKNHTNQWVGYTPGQSYDTVFGISASFGDKSLLAVAGQGGGGEKALGRHAVAALLNAASTVDYAFSTADVIAFVQGAYATGDFERLKDMLEYQNEMGCPLGNGTTEGSMPRAVGVNSTGLSTLSAETDRVGEPEDRARGSRANQRADRRTIGGR